MSADDATQYRQIGDRWYAVQTAVEAAMTAEDYQSRCGGYATLPECLVACHQMECEHPTEYGIIEDEMPEMPKVIWPNPIPIGERLPEVGQIVLYCHWSFGWSIGKFVSIEPVEFEWGISYGNDMKTTRLAEFWLPLPPNPEGTTT